MTESSNSFSPDIKIAVTLDNIDVPQILTGGGLCAALVRCDPKSQQPIPLSMVKYSPLLGRTEVYHKPNATSNPLGILIKFKTDIIAIFAFERRQYVTVALFEGEVTPSSTPIGMTTPFYLSELLLARRHTRNAEMKWIGDSPPMNPSTKVKCTLVASELSGGGIDFIKLQFRGEKMKKMDLFSQSDCFYRLRRVYSETEAPPSVIAKNKYRIVTDANDAKKQKQQGQNAITTAEIIAEVYQSATIDDNANPQWDATDPILVSALSTTDYSKKCIEFACFDEDTFPKSDDQMGTFRVSIADLLFAPANQETCQFKLTAPSKSTPGKIKEYGTIYCTQATMTRLPSAYALFSSGWRMKYTVVVDFSSLVSSAGNSRGAIHYAGDAMDPRRNIVARIVAGTGDVMSLYGAAASLSTTPSLGLAASTASSASSGPSNASFANGLGSGFGDGICLYAYGASIAGQAAAAGKSANGGLLELAAGTNATSEGSNRSMSVPPGTNPLTHAATTNVSSAVRRYAAAIPALQGNSKNRGFGPIINTFANMARQSAAAKQKIFSVVTIIVDGDVPTSEVVALHDALVAADDAPLSVIFVGISQTDPYKNLSAFEVISENSAANYSSPKSSSSKAVAGESSPVALYEDDDLAANSGVGASSSAISNHYGAGTPLRHSSDNRRSRRVVAEFCRFFPRMPEMSRHDIAAEILEGVPAHFMQYAALNDIKA